MEQIAVARELEPDLADAQIVLVTDGEAPVDEAVLAQARSASKGLPVGVSVIALGQENEALRALVARQRASGERAFYHFVDDQQLARITSGAFDEGPAVHLTIPVPKGSAAAKELEREIGPILDELAAIERANDVDVLEGLDAEVQARREAGLVDDGREGERARLEARQRDRVALSARFARWFPQATRDAGAHPSQPTSPNLDDVDAVICVLASVTEVLTLLEAGELARRANAIELLESLLPDAGLTPARYWQMLREYPARVAPALRALHETVVAAA